MDVSADLTELGRTPVAVFCSGPKSILDIPRTLEVLETHGSLSRRSTRPASSRLSTLPTLVSTFLTLAAMHKPRHPSLSTRDSVSRAVKSSQTPSRQSGMRSESRFSKASNKPYASPSSKASTSAGRR